MCKLCIACQKLNLGFRQGFRAAPWGGEYVYLDALQAGFFDCEKWEDFEASRFQRRL